MRQLGHPAPDESATEETVMAKASISGIFTQRDQTSHVPEGEFTQRFLLCQLTGERAGEEDGLLSCHLSRGRQWPAVTTMMTATN